MTATAGPGIEQLHEQLTTLEEALESYRDPIVAQHPGLELMHDTLRERAGHIADTIAEAESGAITLTVEGVPVEHAGVPLGVAHRLLGAVQDAVRHLAGEAHADAAALHLTELSTDESRVSFTLTRRPGPLSAQPTDGEGRLVIDLALAQLVDALGGNRDDDEARQAAGQVAAALVATELTLEVALGAPTVEERTITCDAEALARLL